MYTPLPLLILGVLFLGTVWFTTMNTMLGWGTYSGQFTYSITEVFYYITVVLIFVFYLLLVFTFYIFTSQGDRTYRRVRYNDAAVDNLLEIVSNEL